MTFKLTELINIYLAELQIINAFPSIILTKYSPRSTKLSLYNSDNKPQQTNLSQSEYFLHCFITNKFPTLM